MTPTVTAMSHNFRVIDGGGQPKPEPPADLPPKLAHELINWFASDLESFTGMEGARMLQCRLRSLMELVNGLSGTLESGLDAAATTPTSTDRTEAFVEAFCRGQQNLALGFPTKNE